MARVFLTFRSLVGVVGAGASRNVEGASGQMDKAVIGKGVERTRDKIKTACHSGKRSLQRGSNRSDVVTRQISAIGVC